MNKMLLLRLVQGLICFRLQRLICFQKFLLHFSQIVRGHARVKRRFCLFLFLFAEGREFFAKILAKIRKKLAVSARQAGQQINLNMSGLIVGAALSLADHFSGQRWWSSGQCQCGRLRDAEFESRRCLAFTENLLF